METVKKYKHWFSLWQGGSPLDLKGIRSIFVPLLHEALQAKREVFLLHHYSTEADYNEHHSVAMGLISGMLALKLNGNPGEWIQVGLAGLLSD